MLLLKYMIAKAYFAGGCFWCVEHDLRSVLGVQDVISGYSGDADFVPSYENHRGFAESVEVIYDPSQTSHKKLAQFFLDHIDPTDAGGQFYDRGESYQTAIYYQSDEERSIAEALIQELDESKLYDKPIAVRVVPNPTFYKAEEYHQNYAEKNPDHYKAYSEGSGRKKLQAKVCEIREQKKLEWKD
jgi:peptide methionine sulfoxide reductase msrA/msrB